MIARGMLHLRGARSTTGLRLEDSLELRVSNHGRGYFRINPPGRHMSVDKRFDLFRDSQDI